jgi:hypothetical protein
MTRTVSPETRALICAFIDIAIGRVGRMTAYAPFEPAIAQAILDARRDELFERIVAEWNAPDVLDAAVVAAVTEAIAHHAGPLN